MNRDIEYKRRICQELYDERQIIKDKQKTSGSWYFNGMVGGGYRFALLYLKDNSPAIDLFDASWYDSEYNKLSPVILCVGMMRRNDGFLSIDWINPYRLRWLIEQYWKEEEKLGEDALTSPETILISELTGGSRIKNKKASEHLMLCDTTQKSVISMSEIVGYRMYNSGGMRELLPWFEKMGMRDLLEKYYSYRYKKK